MEQTDAAVFGKENYAKMKELLAQRVGKKRFIHSTGVAKTAKKLAEVYGCDPEVARMAGILHDWDKGLSVEELRSCVAHYGLDVDPVVLADMPWLLHGPCAAAELADKYPAFGPEVFQAVARHTSGALDMTPLDCIIYIADIIEPNRSYGNAEEIEALRALVGEVSLDELYFASYKYSMTFLVSRNRPISPDTVAIWNHLVAQYAVADN